MKTFMKTLSISKKPAKYKHNLLSFAIFKKDYVNFVLGQSLAEWVFGGNQGKCQHFGNVPPLAKHHARTQEKMLLSYDKDIFRLCLACDVLNYLQMHHFTFCKKNVKCVRFVLMLLRALAAPTQTTKHLPQPTESETPSAS
jgi:hypothetical protein